LRFSCFKLHLQTIAVAWILLNPLELMRCGRSVFSHAAQIIVSALNMPISLRSQLIEIRSRNIVDTVPNAPMAAPRPKHAAITTAREASAHHRKKYHAYRHCIMNRKHDN
jgi:hypothetical protein